MIPVRALVFTGYGLNCDYETDHSLKLAGAESHRVHINEFIDGGEWGARDKLDHYHILVLGGGFSWADDHGAGVLLASKLKFNMGQQIEQFIEQGKLIIGICNGFQALVNLGLLPGFEQNYRDRRVAITYNDSGNFINSWVNLKVNPDSPCLFTKGLSFLELPVRHGEGKFYALDEDIGLLFKNSQVVMQYADEKGGEANGQWPMNPNGSYGDIAGICDPTGHIFGLMPHPEAFNHFTNHPDWTRKKEGLIRKGQNIGPQEGDGIRIFRNAVEYIRDAIDSGELG
jgi:phosphoribosylformylglycinamidine synthase